MLVGTGTIAAVTSAAERWEAPPSQGLTVSLNSPNEGKEDSKVMLAISMYVLQKADSQTSILFWR